jgi:two-component system chemotaxis response regulator CheB
MMMKKIKVVIVDDSLVSQALLSDILHRDPDILVVGLAENPIIARTVIKALKPDVLILDVEMPEMDGITFLEKLMRLHPMPVIMCSAFTPKCSEITLEAFRLGIIDMISKPILKEHYQDVINKVKYAAITKVNHINFNKETKIVPLTNKASDQVLNKYIIAIGASTGGTEALKLIFQSLPTNMPPIVVTQHLPKGFSELFVTQINKISKLVACEAKDGQQLQPGHIYLAESGNHLQIESKNKSMFIKYQDTKEVSHHNPSIDIMMESVAKIAGTHGVGILLSGMGADGATGMLALKNAGGITIAQDEETSVIWGMPKVAIDLEAVKYILPIQKIPEKILTCIDREGN